MKRMRKGWLLGLGTTAALLAGATLLATSPGSALLADLTIDEGATPLPAEQTTSAPGDAVYPGFEYGKGADESLGSAVASTESRADGGEAGGEQGAETTTTALLLTTDGRRLVRTGDLALVVDGRDVRAATERVVALTGALDGYVLSSYTGAPGEPAIASPEDAGPVRAEELATPGLGDIESASVAVRVPSASFETAMRRFARLGTVEYESTSAQDVSDQMVDLQARLRHARAVERRLLRFLEATDTIREMLAVQDRLDQVQLEIEQLSARMEAMNEVVAFSTITVSLRAEGDPTPVVGAGGGVWDNFVDAWHLLGRNAVVLLMALAAALPFVIVGGAIAAVVWYGVRRMTRRRDRRASAAGAA